MKKKKDGGEETLSPLEAKLGSEFIHKKKKPRLSTALLHWATKSTLKVPENAFAGR